MYTCYIFNLLKRAPQPLTEPIVRITKRNLPIVAVCSSSTVVEVDCTTKVLQAVSM